MATEFTSDDAAAPPAVAYVLADHLDAALAAAEDLEAAGGNWCARRTAAAGDTLAERAAERAVVEDVRRHEAMLIGRVLMARRRATELAAVADHFSGIARLFVGGTAVLVDAVAELGDSTLADFATGDCLIAFLRSRGVIADDAAGLPESREVTFDQRFLVAGRISLAPLTDMIVAFLDVLEANYDLYPDGIDGDLQDADAADETGGCHAAGDVGAAWAAEPASPASYGAYEVKEEIGVTDAAEPAAAANDLTSDPTAADIMAHTPATMSSSAHSSGASDSLVSRLGAVARSGSAPHA
ncbi:MAG: hypothetical protein KDJ37_12925 [Hyphomicrobiaceae bacterium]|nr:hypothetical protein [Hyphomicrobiaceae bacterium]